MRIKYMEWEKRAFNNANSSLMAHKLSCLTTHFAQLPIHHANTNAPIQRMLSTSAPTITYTSKATAKVKWSTKKATAMKKNTRTQKNQWHQMKWHTNTHNNLMYLSQRITQNYCIHHQQQPGTMHQSILARTPNRTYTWIGFVCHYHC